MDPAAPAAAALDGNRALAQLGLGPDRCTTMAEVRLAVDVTDDLLLALIAHRFRLMDAAARIKTSRDQVRDEARKAAILARVEAEAQRQGVPSGLAAQLWEIMIEASITYEFKRFDEKWRE